MEKRFVLTGNPIVDNGLAALAVICGVENIEEITENKIKENIDSFFESIKNQYNDLNATKKEKKHSKRKLKQHLTGLYTTNHYLHGINNKIVKYQLLITVDEKTDFQNLNEYEKVSNLYIKEFNNENQVKEELQKIERKKFKNTKIMIENSKLIAILNINIEKKNKLNESVNYLRDNGYKHSKTVYSKIFSCKRTVDKEKQKFEKENYIVETKKIKKRVETNEEYFQSFKEEIINILEGSSRILKERKAESNNCSFCGKEAELRITKDLFPLTSSIGAWNLGEIFSCRYCYLASLFYFFNLINLKKDEKSSGVYFFYHFSNPKVMIEYTKFQISYLKNNTLSSLQTIVGGKYSSAFKDLYNKTKSLENVLNENSSSVTIYYLLNDNRGAQYEVLTIPSGLLNFYLALNTLELSNQWGKIQSFLNRKEDYIDFANGIKNIWNFKDKKSHLPVLKNKTIKIYLKEVGRMDEKMIKAIEDLSNMLKEYYKEMYNIGTKKRNNWLEDFYDFFDQTKPYNFFSDLLKINNNYFKITGNNLINVDNLKLILSNSKLFSSMFYLIEFFILNSLSDDEKKLYLNYVKTKKNINE